MNAPEYNAARLANGTLSVELVTELVRHWQKTHGLVEDGKAGPNTLGSLLEATATVGIIAIPPNRCYPLRRLADGRLPLVTSRYWKRNPERSQPDRRHNGADLMYPYDAKVDPPVLVGDSGRTERFWIPEGTAVLAQADGVVELAGPSKTGWRVWVRHQGGYATGSFHLARILVAPGQRVAAGDELGIVGDNPSDRDPDHLHAELYLGHLGGYPAGSIDPEAFWVGAATRPA